MAYDRAPYQEIFSNPWKALSMLVLMLTKAHTAGILVRNVELRHDTDFETKKDKWLVFIRYFNE